MRRGRRERRRGIAISRDVAEAAAIPDDLDADAAGPYAVPEPARRRRAAVVYVVAAVGAAVGIVAGGLPQGMWLAVAGFVAIAAYHVAAAWKLVVREGRALEEANRAIGFPVGHASATLGFRGWRARPIWNVLVFSADDPPSRRGLVRVDAITGAIVETYDEPVPVDEW